MVIYKRSKAGIFPATYNFEDEDDGETDPTGWTNNDGASCTTDIYSEWKTHRKIIRMRDGNLAASCELYQDFSGGTETNGIIEFWTGGIQSEAWCEYQLKNSTTGNVVCRVMNLAPTQFVKAYHTAAWNELVNFTSSDQYQWHHIAIVFNNTGGIVDNGDTGGNLAAGKFRVYVDDIEYGDWNLENGENVDRFLIQSDSGHGNTAKWLLTDAIDYSWTGGYSWNRNQSLDAIYTVSNSNVIKCEITEEIFNFPTAEVILEESEIIGHGQLFQVTDNYSVDNQTSSDIIFEGQVIVKMNNYPFEMMCESRASEAGNFQKPGLKCTGTHSGDSDDVLESIRDDLCDYIIKGLHDAGSAMGDRVYAGDKDIFAAWRNLAMFEGKIWFYKTPAAGTIDIDFTSGDDPASNLTTFTQASNIWDFKAGRARQYFNQVNVQGEIGSTMGTANDTDAQALYGIIPFTHRDASLTTALAATAATNILDVLDNDPLLIQFKYQDATLGFIQPGQYITLAYDLDGVTEVESQTFIVNKIVYNSVSGVGEIWASSEITYNYKMLNYASRQLPMENSELIQQIDQQGITSAGAWYLKPSGDTDDYLEFSTIGGVPFITIQGGGWLKIDGGNDTYLTLDCDDDGGYTIVHGATFKTGLYWNEGWGCTYLYTAGTFRVMPNSDDNDYLYFITAANIAQLLPVENKVHNLGSAALSYDHVYADDFDNTSPFQEFANPLADLKKIKGKNDTEIDYTSLPDFVRTHTRDPKKHVWGKKMVMNEETKEEEEKDYIVERAPKDVMEDTGWSVNRMAVFLYQTCQKLQEQNEQLEARIKDLEKVITSRSSSI